MSQQIHERERQKTNWWDPFIGQGCSLAWIQQQQAFIEALVTRVGIFCMPLLHQASKTVQFWFYSDASISRDWCLWKTHLETEGTCVADVECMIVAWIFKRHVEAMPFERNNGDILWSFVDKRKETKQMKACKTNGNGHKDSKWESVWPALWFWGVWNSTHGTHCSLMCEQWAGNLLLASFHLVWEMKICKTSLLLFVSCGGKWKSVKQAFKIVPQCEGIALLWCKTCWKLICVKVVKADSDEQSSCQCVAQELFGLNWSLLNESLFQLTKQMSYPIVFLPVFSRWKTNTCVWGQQKCWNALMSLTCIVWLCPHPHSVFNQWKCHSMVGWFNALGCIGTCKPNCFFFWSWTNIVFVDLRSVNERPMKGFGHEFWCNFASLESCIKQKQLLQDGKHSCKCCSFFGICGCMFQQWKHAQSKVQFCVLVMPIDNPTNEFCLMKMILLWVSTIPLLVQKCTMCQPNTVFPNDAPCENQPVFCLFWSLLQKCSDSSWCPWVDICQWCASSTLPQETWQLWHLFMICSLNCPCRWWLDMKMTRHRTFCASPSTIHSKVTMDSDCSQKCELSWLLFAMTDNWTTRDHCQLQFPSSWQLQIAFHLTPLISIMFAHSMKSHLHANCSWNGCWLANSRKAQQQFEVEELLLASTFDLALQDGVESVETTQFWSCIPAVSWHPKNSIGVMSITSQLSVPDNDLQSTFVCCLGQSAACRTETSFVIPNFIEVVVILTAGPQISDVTFFDSLAKSFWLVPQKWSTGAVPWGAVARFSFWLPFFHVDKTIFLTVKQTNQLLHCSCSQKRTTQWTHLVDNHLVPCNMATAGPDNTSRFLRSFQLCFGMTQQNHKRVGPHVLLPVVTEKHPKIRQDFLMHVILLKRCHDEPDLEICREIRGPCQSQSRGNHGSIFLIVTVVVQFPTTLVQKEKPRTTQMQPNTLLWHSQQEAWRVLILINGMQLVQLLAKWCNCGPHKKHSHVPNLRRMERRAAYSNSLEIVKNSLLVPLFRLSTSSLFRRQS